MPQLHSMSYSSEGFALTRGFEGLRLSAYQDSAGIWTIGCGHTGREVRAGERITEAEAEALLHADLRDAIDFVNRHVDVPLLQHQFDALVDFCFNAGRGSLEHSTLLAKVNAGDMAAAAEQFGQWVHAGGKVVSGLVRRRQAEAAMFRKEAVSVAA